VKPIYQVLVGVLAGFMLAGGIMLVARAPAGEPITLQPAPTKAPIVVQVDGAVPRPGVYELAEGSRVQDAVTAAGGLLAEADATGINLAARLEDGQQLNIPYGSGSAGPPPPAFTDEEPPTAPADLININTASSEELDSLPGIGPTTAQKIIDYRIQHGDFQQIEDIMNVSGIGPATFDDIKDLITVGP
jgi:competence protein ComEA